jgi:hypothetical protein
MQNANIKGKTQINNKHLSLDMGAKINLKFPDIGVSRNSPTIKQTKN